MNVNKKHIIWGLVLIIALAIIFTFWGPDRFSSVRSEDFVQSFKGATSVAPMMESSRSLVDVFIEDGDVNTPDRMVVKSGSLDMVVKNLSEAIDEISSFALASGGWVVSSNLVNHEANPSAYISVRVPADKYDGAMAQFRGLAETVKNEYSQGEDVTKQYTDLSSRLKNLEASRAQLLKLMERTGEVSDILSVQRELSNVSSQIEVLKGQVQYLETNVAMSSISVSLALSEDLLPVAPGDTWRPMYVLKAAWKSLLNALKDLSYLVIRLVVYAIIWVPIGLILWWIYRTIRRRSLKNK